MSSYKKKKLILILIYVSFFIAIPIIKNESRLIEKKIQNYQGKIFTLEKNLLEASLEFQYLTSPAVLVSKIEKDLDPKYNNLNFSQIYPNIDSFILEQNKTTSSPTNEKQKK
tara:strand:+ start:1644 stop:1979 length:336 start_codon:yes stop_codon:yes gene_type:complete